ncbi:P22 phage major capsid protein family protein [Nonomuraea thailandensis]
MAFHRTAFALVTRPLVLPQGAANAAVESYKGFGVRVVMDYDISKSRTSCRWTASTASRPSTPTGPC